jgi:hypothetical protein
VQIWNGTELVPIADELLHSPHFLQPTAPPLELPGGAGLDSAPLESYVSRKAAEPEDYDDEEDVYKNWRPPNQDTDFAAHAGQAEKAVLQKLGFNLMLNSKEIGGSHGLDAKGFLTPDALRAIGIGNYTRLWRRSGKVAEEARKMLRREKYSAAAREQVRLARNDLELSIFYRQLDVMAFRFPRQHTRRWYEHKEALLKKSKQDILNEYRRDCEDRKHIRSGQVVANTRQQELASACDSHLYQLDMRYETMQELQGLLLCQVLFSSYHLYGEPFWRLMRLLFVLLAHDRNVDMRGKNEQECLAAESTERNGQMNSSDNKFYCNTCLEML